MAVDEKRIKVNDCLKIKTTELDMGFLNHHDIDSNLHCNSGGLLLNFNGTYALGSNFAKMISAWHDICMCDQMDEVDTSSIVMMPNIPSENEYGITAITESIENN